MVTGKDMDGESVCVYVYSTNETGRIKISAADLKDAETFSFTADGEELIKAIKNAMNV